MTDPRDLSPADLEAVSAHLDGEATPEESARVAGDPDLQDAVVRLRAVRDRLAVADPPEAVAESRLAAALAAFDSGPSVAPVVHLAAERERRWYHRLPLGAVAAALLAAAVVGAITQIEVDSGDDTATGADSAGEASSTEETMAADAPAGVGGGAGADALETDDSPASTPSAAGAALEFATVDELADHVTRELGSGAARSQQLEEAEGDAPDATPEDGAGDEDSGFDDAGCDPVSAAGIEGAPLVAMLSAVLDGRGVTAVVVDDAGDRRLVVVDDATCTVTDDRILDP